MDLRQVASLLPCQSLEDFPLQHNAADAEQLLSAWSAAWHPALLKAARSMPTWHPAETPPSEPSGHVVLLPDCSVPLLAEGWLEQAASAGALVVRDWRCREDLLQAIFARLEPPPATLDAELTADFLALGFCHFQVELLTRQLRYMSNLDEETFFAEMLAAADEACAGDKQAAHERLETAFSLLHEAREYFYPVEAHLLDLTLAAPTTLGESLREQLAAGARTNLLISAEDAQMMARREPATCKALRDALEAGTASILGGEFAEVPLPLLPPEAIRRHIEQGLDAYQQALGARPKVFARRRFGLTPALPQILTRLGFTAAMHCTLDDGRFPTANQSRIQWQGIDGTSIDSVGRVPLDVSAADAFLRLPERLGDAMDLDHVATIVLAHWPGQTSYWYEDLRRIAAYTPVGGTLTTFEDYFENSALSGPQTEYHADRYRSPYLKQDVAAGRADPISRWARYYRRRAVAEAAQTFDALATLTAGRAAEHADLFAEVERTLRADGDDDQLDQQLQSQFDGALRRLADSLGGAARPRQPGYLVANPGSHSRRTCLELPELPRPPAVQGAVRAAEGTSVVLDVPAMGFAWVGPGPEPERPIDPPKKKRRRKAKEDPPLAERREDGDAVLRNDFLQVVVDPHTGALRAISDYYSRGTRLAQQLAVRRGAGADVAADDDANYSIMAADDVSVTSPGPMLGEVVARGRLVDREARSLAGFTQTTRVRRGSRIIELEIELDVGRQPGPAAWQSYYAARFAWSDATANLYRSVNMANLPTDAVQLETPHFVDVRSGKVRTTLLFGGLPYHRRFGLRKLDTLLVVRGERARRFRLGIGIDVPHPMAAALDFLAPDAVLSAASCPAAPAAWLFHLDARNVVATHWAPIAEDDRIAGFRVRLLETDGLDVALALRCLRPVASAHKAPTGDTSPPELPIDDDRITVALHPHEWAEVEARFATQR